MLKYHSFYYVYIVLCADGSFYTGQTSDLEIRLKEHNGERKGGARYTRTRRPVTLHYYEQYNSRSVAMRREYKLKQLTHNQKKNLCS